MKDECAYVKTTCDCCKNKVDNPKKLIPVKFALECTEKSTVVSYSRSIDLCNDCYKKVKSFMIVSGVRKVNDPLWNFED